MVSFAVLKVLSLMYTPLYIFAFVVCAFGVKFKNYLQDYVKLLTTYVFF